MLFWSDRLLGIISRFDNLPLCWGTAVEVGVGKAVGLTALAALLSEPSHINFLQRAEELSQIVKIIVCAGHRGD
jgi:hypothetical protein